VLRRGVAATALWTLIVSIGVIFVPGRVQMCLGPLNVTPESCRAAMGLPPETDWDRFAAGPVPIFVVAAIGYTAIGLWSVWSNRAKRQRAGL